MKLKRQSKNGGRGDRFKVTIHNIMKKLSRYKKGREKRADRGKDLGVKDKDEIVVDYLFHIRYPHEVCDKYHITRKQLEKLYSEFVKGV